MSFDDHREARIDGIRSPAGKIIGFVGVTGDGNHAAIRFYERQGARRVGRSERDGLGNPYPLLHFNL